MEGYSSHNKPALSTYIPIYNSNHYTRLTLSWQWQPSSNAFTSHYIEPDGFFVGSRLQNSTGSKSITLKSVHVRKNHGVYPKRGRRLHRLTQFLLGKCILRNSYPIYLHKYHPKLFVTPICFRKDTPWGYIVQGRLNRRIDNGEHYLSLVEWFCTLTYAIPFTKIMYIWTNIRELLLYNIFLMYSVYAIGRSTE